jgi:16S rRNA (uracil1498-N3)-methyltransferase
VSPGERLDVRDARARLIVDALPDAGGTVALPREEVAHVRARRLVPGDAVILLDGTGRLAVAEILRPTRGETLVRVSDVVPAAPAGPAISLAVSGLRAEKVAWLVEKATELGVARVVVLATDRTQGFRASPKVLPRLEKVARAAAKQSERADWPSIVGPVAFEAALHEEKFPQRFFLDFSGDRFPRQIPPLPCALLVGPEGGWTESERARARDLGWKNVTLPAGKLRAETAAVAAVILVRAAMEAKTR